MKPTRVNEAEVVDTVVGGAPPEVELRVEQLLRTDETVAWHDRYWSDLVQLVRRQTRPTREMAARIETRVMEQLPNEAEERERWLAAPLEPWPPRSPLRWLSDLFVTRPMHGGCGAVQFIRRHGMRLAVAALMALGIYEGKQAWRSAHPESTVIVLGATPVGQSSIASISSSNLALARREDTKTSSIKYFPHSITLDNRTSEIFELSGGIKIAAEPGAHIELSSQSNAWHMGGTANYLFTAPQPTTSTQAFVVHCGKFNLIADVPRSPASSRPAPSIYELRISDQPAFTTLLKGGIGATAIEGNWLLQKPDGSLTRFNAKSGIVFDPNAVR